MVGGSGVDVPNIGDRVRIPWGVDVLDGIVVEIQTTTMGSRAVVQVDLPGAVEEDGAPATVTLPLSALQPADWWPDATGRIGGWAAYASYERHVLAAFERILANRKNIRFAYPRHGMDRGYDLLIEAPEGVVAVEMKYYARRRTQTGQVRQLIEATQKAVERTERADLIIVVTNIDVSLALMQEQIINAVVSDTPIRVVTWRSQADDPPLAGVIERWLGDDGKM